MRLRTIQVQTDPTDRDSTEKLQYRLYGDKWQVKDPETGEFRDFASGSADSDDVKQLLRKEFDARY